MIGYEPKAKPPFVSEPDRGVIYISLMNMRQLQARLDRYPVGPNGYPTSVTIFSDGSGRVTRGTTELHVFNSWAELGEWLEDKGA